MTHTQKVRQLKKIIMLVYGKKEKALKTQAIK
jgi:hypothetical protein